MYELDLALNNLKGSVCYKTPSTNYPTTMKN